MSVHGTADTSKNRAIILLHTDPLNPSFALKPIWKPTHPVKKSNKTDVFSRIQSSWLIAPLIRVESLLGNIH